METKVIFKFQYNLVCKSCGAFIHGFTPNTYTQDQLDFEISDGTRCPHCSSDSLDIVIASNKFYKINN